MVDLTEVDKALLPVLIPIVILFFVWMGINEYQKPHLFGRYSFCSKSFIKKSEDEYRKKYCEKHPYLGWLCGYNKPYTGDYGYPD